ncbi:hypothetical protein IEQ34_010975 [Dendrobium chrysotoxum]|uniref:Uncharacterized protein n=1 Tax=Dendrobium chrysotoxum TaxID=161865 RepID=A0AAV7GWE5_DENCH|nr:hypothetical protein IEQ34_010975 [Dendrobium chrysotoxum]
MLAPALSPARKQDEESERWPAADIRAIFVGGGKAVLRREAVVDGDDDRRDLAGEASAEEIVAAVVGGEVCEAAAVEEDDEWKVLAAAVGCGEEEANPEVSVGVDGEVEGVDAALRGGVWGGSEIDEGEETAVDRAVGASGGLGDGGEEGDGKTQRPWKCGLCGVLRHPSELSLLNGSQSKDYPIFIMLIDIGRRDREKLGLILQRNMIS